MEVYTYWRCPYCKGIVHGKERSCPNCGSAIPNNVKYMMPDNPEVMRAIKNGEILMRDEAHTLRTEEGYVAEIVDKEDENEDPNWLCEFCGYQNPSDATSCKGCGAPRGDKTYFDAKSEEEEKRDRHKRTYGKFDATPMKENKDDDYEKYQEYVEEEEKQRDAKERLAEYKLRTRRNERQNEQNEELEKTIRHGFLICIGVLLFIAIMIWLYTPVTRQAFVESFRWTRSISVDEYKKCRESDWSLPSGATLVSTAEEVHHYEQVFDHYETKTKQVPYQVLDGYDTSFRDLGNGRSEVIKTPRYRTEYKTETYQEAVYRQEPVYRTKYYYDIGRWKKIDSLDTRGNGQEPYWAETSLPTSVSSPSFGDKRQGVRSENYYVTLKPEEGEVYETTFSYDKWKNMKVGDYIEYQSYRFSKKPIE